MAKKTIEVDAVKRALTRKTVESKEYLSTGSTLLNLALTGTPDGGFLKGSYVLFVGDTDSGKTFICMTCLAEASINPAFDDYRFLFINKERGVLMDIERFFGPKVVERLEMVNDVETVEDMYFALDDAIEEKRPFICVVDSIDALSSDYEGKKFDERKSAARKGTQAKGDYGDGKAKIHSSNIRRVLSGLERTGSIVIFINQTRDNIDGGMFSPPSTHSGGRAISFYATMKLWSSPGTKITKVYRDKQRQIGITSRIKVERTRVTGKKMVVDVPIYNSFGIDDIGSCIDYLLSEGHWKKAGQSVEADDFEFKGTHEKLVVHIEEEGLEEDLRDLVWETWQEIEAACRIQRKSRYRQKEA